MQKTKITWENPQERWKLDFTLNPIIGCKKSCSYCYAKKISDRFKMIPNWNEPQFFDNRLQELHKLKNPSTIFIGSMSDVFGEWVPKEWIDKILYTISELPQHRFMFLTKNPQRYHKFYFPINCWLGATIESNKQLDRLGWMLSPELPNNTFLSIEPLLGDFHNVDLSGIDLVIAGGMTGAGAIKPKKEWVKSIHHHNIFYKDSVKKYL